MSTPIDFANGAQALVAALSTATIDPADAIRLLTTLAAFSNNSPTSSTPIGQNIAMMQRATGDLFRRSAVIGLARASSAYQPSSSDDAAAIRDIVCSAIDVEIQIAGDQGEDATFNTLRALRTAVVNDLSMRGAELPTMGLVSTAAPVTATVLAQRLYQDANRTKELVIQANPIHPAFMPLHFKALQE